MEKYKRINSCAERIKFAMDLKGIKQSDICKITGIPKSAMSQYVSGAFEPKQDRIYLIAKALNVSEPWLMGIDAPMQRSEKILDENTLTEDERLLVNLFRQVPSDIQKNILENLRLVAKLQK